MQFNPILAKAQIPRRGFHALRHTGATLLLLRGANLKAVSQRLGHANVETTLRTYAHVLPPMEDQIVGILVELFRPAATVRLQDQGEAG